MTPVARGASNDERLRNIGWTERTVRDDLGPCWEWNGTRSHGYGRVRRAEGGYMAMAQRVAYETWVGPVGDAHVLHRCDNPPCINPAHLFLGTNADNIADRVAKGRDGNHKGEAHGGSKLTDEQVIAIRAETGLQREIAARYGVSQQLISQVRLGQGWSHVTEEESHG